MILHPLKIEAKENNLYLITFTSEKGELQFPFQVERMKIDEDVIPVASWDVSFSVATVEEDRDYADELLQAIHCLNQLRELEPGISKVAFENQEEQTCRYRVTIEMENHQSDLFVDVANGVARGSVSTLSADATEPLLKMIERFDHSRSLSQHS